MNSKNFLIVGAIVAACMSTVPIAMAAGHGHGGGSFAGSRAGFSAPRGNFGGPRPGFYGARAGYAAQRASFNYQRQGQFSRRSGAVAGNWRGNGNWHGSGHHGHRYGCNNVVFIGGYPYYGYGWDYPYWGGYYPYWGGYYPYDGGYYSDYNGAGVYQGGDASLILQVQERLARAGYYHGAIDGLIGGKTRSAIRAYERSHRLPVDGVIDDDLLARMGLS